jgi:hypothetical protein
MNSLFKSFIFSCFIALSLNAMDPNEMTDRDPTLEESFIALSNIFPLNSQKLTFEFRLTLFERRKDFLQLSEQAAIVELPPHPIYYASRNRVTEIDRFLRTNRSKKYDAMDVD